ncbi:hypothetical protein SBOR_9439 [Sclerotinia borealis F-4128]|uniref:2EXR domain-containing protein n=1 Tax=Sclerotinia borealis (strain F-4128) TaxID=1432307 RepID=W9C2R6_SCLBF|nr:hypothetical protein SBOR_9439 [Sclerotinia borealis F-4128]
MVQYSHVPNGVTPKRVAISQAVSKISPGNIRKRLLSKLSVSKKPIEPVSGYFSNLPLEIRLKIWRACFEPRRVTICTRYKYITPKFKHAVFGMSGLWVPVIMSSHASMPLTLFINRESRYETLKYYPDLIQNPTLFCDPIYFNSELDSLAIETLQQRSFSGIRDVIITSLRCRELWCVKEKQIKSEVSEQLIALGLLSESFREMVRWLVIPRCVMNSTVTSGIDHGNDGWNPVGITQFSNLRTITCSFHVRSLKEIEVVHLKERRGEERRGEMKFREETKEF